MDTDNALESEVVDGEESSAEPDVDATDVTEGPDGGLDPVDMDVVDRTSDTNAICSSSVTYKSLSLGDSFADFFVSNRSKILVREEYPALIEHLRKVQAQTYPRGAVVTGQPGIGKELPKLLSSHLDASQGKLIFSATR